MREFLLQYFDEKIIDEILNAKKYKRLYGKTNSPLSKYNQVDMEVCKTLYIDYKMPIYKIAMLYGVSDATMRTYLINNNIIMRGHKCGKNSDNNYFKKIDSADKAYFLGLLVADGCLHYYSDSKKRISLALTQDDSYIIDKFNSYGNFNEKIYLTHKEDKKPRSAISIHSIKIYDDLYKLGLKPNKSHVGTSFPKIPKKYYSHFIRGYFDGDGIAYAKGYIGFCGSLQLLQSIHSILINKLKINDVAITYNKSNNIYYMTWGSRKDCKKIFKYLYKDKKDLYLIRKYDKLKNILE